MVEYIFCKYKVIGSNPIISKQHTSLQDGIEPATLWLTAIRSTIELLKTFSKNLIKYTEPNDNYLF